MQPTTPPSPPPANDLLDMAAYRDATPEEKVIILNSTLEMAASTLNRLGDDRDTLLAAVEAAVALLDGPVCPETARAALLTLRLARSGLLTVAALDEPYMQDILRDELMALLAPRTDDATA